MLCHNRVMLSITISIIFLCSYLKIISGLSKILIFLFRMGGDITMSTSKELTNEKYQSIKKLGKMYLYLLIATRLVFLMEHVPHVVNAPIGNDVIDVSKYLFQLVIGNEFVKRISILFLALYSMFVAVESFLVLRTWFMWLYSKVTRNKMIE